MQYYVAILEVDDGVSSSLKVTSIQPTGAT